MEDRQDETFSMLITAEIRTFSGLVRPCGTVIRPRWMAQM